MAFNSQAAAAYLQNWEPYRPVPGYGAVKSTVASDAAAAALAQEAQAKSGLAGLALNQLGAQALAKQEQDFVAEQNALTRRSQGLRLATQLLGPSYEEATATANLGVSDPFALIEKFGKLNDWQRTAELKQATTSNAYASELFKLLNS